MKEEFRKTPDGVVSRNGFTIKTKLAGGVSYLDSVSQVEIDSEWMVKPAGIILYKGSQGNKGFEKLEQAAIDNIFLNTKRALEHLGYKVEIWSSPTGPIML